MCKPSERIEYLFLSLSFTLHSIRATFLHKSFVCLCYFFLNLVSPTSFVSHTHRSRFHVWCCVAETSVERTQIWRQFCQCTETLLKMRFDSHKTVPSMHKEAVSRNWHEELTLCETNKSKSMNVSIVVATHIFQTFSNIILKSWLCGFLAANDVWFNSSYEFEITTKRALEIWMFVGINVHTKWNCCVFNRMQPYYSDGHRLQ